MGIRKIFIFLVLMLFFSLVGCVQTNEKGQEELNDKQSNPVTIPQKIIEPPEPVQSTEDKMIEQMTVAEKVGQLLVIGMDGKSFTSETDNLIRNHHVGGIILMGKNVSTTPEMLKLINDSKKANEQNKIPLFISVDEEGGRVSRLPAGVKKLPSAKQIGKRDDETFNYQLGNYLAELLIEFGYNMDFAPVMDVNSNPKNPVIGDRSFGSDPETVARLGISTMHGMMDNGVIPVIKHFPGHGDTDVDSHKSLPIEDKSLDTLRTNELIPFQRAIDSGAEVVMVAHILFPAVDTNYPASLSKAIITGLLRNDMQYDGVVITDDLTMRAITNDYTVPEAAVKAFMAGSDLLLMVGNATNQIETVQALITEIETGNITEERLDESVRRILRLKYKYGLSDNLNDEVDVDKINSLYDQLFAK